MALSGCGVNAAGGDERPEAAPDAPNIVAIVLDDATADMLTPESMPVMHERLVHRGTTFSNFVVTTPLCCPSRVAYLTGQYGHNNGVLKNDYRRLKKKGRVLPRWLQLAGYRTMHVGKYPNNFAGALDDRAEVPWGWDEWFTLLDNDYYDYEVSDNGEVVSFDSDPESYVTRVLNRRALDLVSEYSGKDEPFYLQLDHYAPHPSEGNGPKPCVVGASPGPAYSKSVRELPVPEKQSRNEADVSDKPAFLREAERLRGSRLRRAELRYQCAVAALDAVDRGIGQLIDRLDEEGELDRTAFILTSDNGFFFGEHRIPQLKGFAYEENLRMPLVVRLPSALGVEQPREVDALTANIDLAPTVLELARAAPCHPARECRPLDGRSLLPLLDSKADAKWPADRAVLIELGQKPPGIQSLPRACSYIGVRTADQVLIEHRSVATEGTACRPTDAVEHYDLRSDPEQLDNLATSGRGRAAREKLRQRLEQLRECSGNVSEQGSGAGSCE